MDIIKDLWQDFLDRKGKTLRAEIADNLGFTPTRNNVIMDYEIGGDTGVINFIDELTGNKTAIGSVWVDYSEPEINYKIK